MSLEALKRPFSARALPGLLVVLIPILEFLGVGYKMACARTAMSGNYELPQWKNWKQLLIFGAKVRFIQLIWLTPAIITFVLLFYKIKSLASASAQTIVALPQLFAIRNILIIFFVLLVVAAIFAPACILNYIAEARFKAAFSFSVLRRMLSKAYLIGWLAAGLYAVIAVAVLLGFFFLISGFVQTASPVLLSIAVLPVELIMFWLPGITYWTLLGEYWGKSISREYRSTL